MTDRNDARGIAQMVRAGGAFPSGACEDVVQSETANAADPSQVAPVEGNRHQHENRAGSKPIEANSIATERWNVVPRGMMDEVSLHIRWGPPFVGRQVARKIVK